MLFKISLANIKKSFKDYAVYFFTLILGVAIFYVFNAIESQTVLLDVTSNTVEIIKLMTNMLSGVSVFVSFILGFLVIYASRFLIKRRNKEFGIYLTLGMSKRKISLILFFETLCIGILSLFVGLGIGVVMSQFMSLLVANMFDADMTKFTFVFSSSVCVKTLMYFAIMYLLVMIFNTINISKCKLIDLLHSKKKSEKVRMKNPLICTIIFILAICMLGYAYYLVTDGFAKLQDAKDIFKPILLGTISTFFLFWSLSGLLINIFTKWKRVYYKKLNSFTLRQFSSKINTTVFSTTIICLMLFITICVLSSGLSIKNSMTANLDRLAPADVQFDKRVNLTEKDKELGYTDAQISNTHLTVLETFDIYDFNIRDYLKEYVEYNTYKTPDLTMGHTLGSRLEEIKKQYLFLTYDTPETILKISDYNKIARLYGKKEYSLKEKEYIIIADFQSMITVRNIALMNQESIHLFGHTLTPKYKECQEGFLEMNASHVNSGIILVADSVVDENYISNNGIIGNYKTTDKQEKVNIEKEIMNLVKNPKKDTYLLPNGITKLSIAESSGGLGALVTFIALYLGIIFLISSAAILALKELSESADNKERFRIIRKLGADEKVINKTLFNQIGIFFLFPLLLAIIHSIFGLKFCLKILETFGSEEMLPSVIMSAIFLILIYGGYFLITYVCSKNIIKEK